MRRWKLLVVLNAFAVAGFFTFWGKCDVRLNKIGNGHTRLNGSSSDSSISQEVLLKRLGSLEDVVYRQLNGNFIPLRVSARLYTVCSTEKLVVLAEFFQCSTGLSKSLGLIEGFRGQGRGGLPATLAPEQEKLAKSMQEKYGYNAFLSDRISLDRSIPDYRPSK